MDLVGSIARDAERGGHPGWCLMANDCVCFWLQNDFQLKKSGEIVSDWRKWFHGYQYVFNHHGSSEPWTIMQLFDKFKMCFLFACWDLWTVNFVIYLWIHCIHGNVGSDWNSLLSCLRYVKRRPCSVTNMEPQKNIKCLEEDISLPYWFLGRKQMIKQCLCNHQTSGWFEKWLFGKTCLMWQEHIMFSF